MKNRQNSVGSHRSLLRRTTATPEVDTKIHYGCIIVLPATASCMVVDWKILKNLRNIVSLTQALEVNPHAQGHAKKKKEKRYFAKVGSSSGRCRPPPLSHEPSSSPPLHLLLVSCESPISHHRFPSGTSPWSSTYSSLPWGWGPYAATMNGRACRGVGAGEPDEGSVPNFARCCLFYRNIVLYLTLRCTFSCTSELMGAEACDNLMYVREVNVQTITLRSGIHPIGCLRQVTVRSRRCSRVDSCCKYATWKTFASTTGCGSRYLANYTLHCSGIPMWKTFSALCFDRFHRQTQKPLFKFHPNRENVI